MAIQPNTRPLARGALPAADRARLAEATRLQQEGRLADAEPMLRQLLLRHTASFDALNGLGLLACQLGRDADAVQLLRAALSVDAKQSDTLVNLARALHRTGEADAAAACIDMALGLDAGDDEARLEGAGWLVKRGRAVDAARLLAPMMQPEAAIDAASLLRAGQASLALGHLDAALRAFEQSHALGSPGSSALMQMGETLLMMGRPSDAADAFAQVLGLDPHALAALRGRGTALLRLGRFDATLTVTQQWVAAEPASVNAWNLHGAALMSLRRFEEANECFRHALQIDPAHRPALSNFAITLQSLHQNEDAALALERLLALWPEAEYIKGKLLHCKMLVCDWLNHDKLLAEIAQDVDAGRASAEPFGMQAYIDSPARLQRAARTFANLLHPDRSAAHASAVLAPHAKIHVGYVSGEFRQQATALLMVELLELHDRDHFEVFAFDNGVADGSPHRRRIETAVAELVPIAACSDEQALQLIRDREIDILVNLNGYFGLARSDLFSLRPAPVQVNFLGFPGTMGAAYMDYLVADHIVVPPEHRVNYDEAVVQMPDCYQPNDTRRTIAPAAALRREHGLPEQGFVFCNFDNVYKITPDIFSVWMRLLESVPGSVLWLLQAEDAEAACDNLVAEAQWRGVAGERLVFAPHVSVEQHIARLRLADLVLDTLPCNAHITGSDALWAGVPMVTCLGTSFPGRVGASLLSAAGLPGLITQSLAEYEALALRLATTPAELASVRNQLAQHQTLAPLFDTDRYRQHLEAAYEEMVRRARLGLPPAPIEVAALTPSPNASWPGATSRIDIETESHTREQAPSESPALP
jgi:protein O-GlcNAc transferase